MNKENNGKKGSTLDGRDVLEKLAQFYELCLGRLSRVGRDDITTIAVLQNVLIEALQNGMGPYAEMMLAAIDPVMDSDIIQDLEIVRTEKGFAFNLVVREAAESYNPFE